jgi:hypothetical protein
MSMHILAYFQREWKRLHDEFEHFLKHGKLPDSSPGASDHLVITDTAVPATPQQGPLGQVSGSPVGVNPTVGSMGAGATDPNYVDPRFPNGVPSLVADPSFDPYRTSINCPADYGKLFKTHTGSRSLNVSAAQRCRFWLLQDGQETPGRFASWRVDDGPVQQCKFQGPADIIEAGAHTILISSNVEMSVEFQPSPD